jgi:N-methylhydantoinase A
VLLTDPEPDRVRRIVEELGGGRAVYDLRYRGQAFELSIEADPEDLREAFEAAHEQAYGYRDGDAEVELVTVRVTAAEPGPEVSPDVESAGATRSRRDTAFGPTTVLRGEPAPGDDVEGPAIVELAESTLVVPPGWQGRVEAGGTVRLWTR